MTANDLRVLRAVAASCANCDGFAPHGRADWTAIRRLIAAGLAAYSGDGVCVDCDSAAHRREPTEGPIYRLTAAGQAALAAAERSGR